jgi:DNA invertase Pin-like site-specific DNA recombinase
MGTVGQDTDKAEATPVRAAEYLRMSTEHQRYSTENQAKIIHQYAEKHCFEIVRSYADEGKSGLTFKGRPEMQRMLADVENGTADFAAILIYDVTRWGRYQDSDESTFYEYRFKQAGVKIVFCAEQFQNDGSIGSDIHRLVSKKMASDHSRVLSVKVHLGQTNLIEKGFRQGGPAGFGLRRQLVDDKGNRKFALKRLEHKSIQTDRVILIPGPGEEVATVREIYADFVERGLTESQIAAKLNARGIHTDLDRLWTRGTVHQVLINEKYIGNNVWNRTSNKLKTSRVRNTPSQWVRADNAFEAIISKELFDSAQTIIASRSYRLSDEEMLTLLRTLLQRHGYLSGLIIDETEKCPSSSSYQNRFGSLLRTYQLIGYQPDRDYRYIEINRRLRQKYPQIVAMITAELQRIGAAVRIDHRTDVLTLNDEITAVLALSRCHATAAGSHRWLIRLDASLGADITIAVRMETGEQSAKDYYLLPSLDVTSERLRLAENNGSELDIYRFDSLGALFDLAKRTFIRELIR